jgi:hypothetical protein
MRLVVSGGPWSVWSRLEPETAEERLVLEACIARGERTSGSGVAAIAPLRALAARLGYPVEALDPRVTLSPSPRLVVVQRAEPTLYARLTAVARAGITVIWDRRHGERRTTTSPPAVERRRRGRRDRRRPPPETWSGLGFLVVPAHGPRPPG